MSATQIAIATGQFPEVRCPVCDGGRFYIPDNQIGVVCQLCGAWSLVKPVPEIEELVEKDDR